MRFWDSSALIPLLVHEERSAELRQFPPEDIVVWWASGVECASALARLERNGRQGAGFAVLYGILEQAQRGWSVIASGEEIKALAIRLVRVHPLRAADALQLAAAILAAQYRPVTLPFVCLDERLRTAATKEGFPLLPASSE